MTPGEALMERIKFTMDIVELLSLDELVPQDSDTFRHLTAADESLRQALYALQGQPGIYDEEPE